MCEKKKLNPNRSMGDIVDESGMKKNANLTSSRESRGKGGPRKLNLPTGDKR